MMASQPDILFIILDTQRRDRLSLYGNERETSPHLDAFARDATVFERAIAPAQWTIPSHGSLFTGVYPGTHQVTQAFQRLSGSHPTLADILRVAQYHTVAFCNNPLLGLLEHDLQRGFLEFYNYAGATPNRPVERTRSPLRRKLASWMRQIARSATNQFSQSDWLFRMSINPLIVPVWERLANFKGDSGRSIDDLIDYMQEYHAGGADKPLFAFLNLMGTHTPYHPASNYLNHVAPELRHDNHASKFVAQFNADAGQWISPADPPLQDWQRHALNGFYDAEIAQQDVHLSRLFAYLEQSGRLDNTLVVIAADHGEGHGDHDFVGHSFVVYQELVHVPLIIRYPQHFPAGRRIHTNVSTRRLFHTILDMADVQPPLADDDPNANVSGLSLVSSLNGKPDTERDTAFSEAFPPVNLLNILEERKPHLVKQMALQQVRRGVYQGDHKLAIVGEKVEKLFDVGSDPAEVNDVATQHPAVVAQLHKKIDTFVSQTQSQRHDSQHSDHLSEDVLDNLRALGYID